MYRRVAERLLHSRYAVALTGAGISVESGIPDFRSAKGLWSRFDPMEYGHIDSFRRNPGRVWKMLLEMDALLLGAHPNPAHFAMAELEQRGILKETITQNIDSLHQRAGSRRVVEFHGHNRSLSCDSCGTTYPRENISLAKVPPTCNCGQALRPEIVFFGEDIPRSAYMEAYQAVEKCDVLLVVGTSATVAPASLLPVLAKERGAHLVEVNPTPTNLTHSLTDVHIAEAAAGALPRILSAVIEHSS
jgi:NAD-dependent deacetylase